MPVIPASQEVKIRRIIVQGQLQQKISKIPFQSISQAWLHMPEIPAMKEAIGRSISPSEASPDPKGETLPEK
jgi:hypothetical protein